MSGVLDQTIPASVTATQAAPAPPRPWKENIFWALSLSAFGLTIYLGTNRIVAAMPSRLTFVFSWERRIPLIPAFIIPYWSTDLLYLFGPLLCTSRAEVRGHAARMIFALIIGCICFVIFPLHLAYPRPQLAGLFGSLFHLLFYWDRPVNMAPSLHVTEIMLLWVIYCRHTSGWLRSIIQIWFVLVIASTLLVWQHHVIDVITGLLLGVVCFLLFPDRRFVRALPAPG